MDTPNMNNDHDDESVVSQASALKSATKQQCFSEITKASSNVTSTTNNLPEPDYFIKILLLGDTGVGKSSIMSAYLNGEFPRDIIGTNGIDHKVKNIRLNGK